MKKIFICLLCCCMQLLHAQVYNNEWIDFNKAYYKIKVGKTGLHRVAKTDLAAAGLASVPVEQLQLWRNGVEVPIYTTVASGTLPDGAFVEFWGERNDGKADQALYRRPEYQLNDRFSLQTDTSVYFLTINAAGSNRRLVPADNNLVGNSLPPEPYLMYTLNQSFNNQLNGGFAVDVDYYLYSAAYDLGEGYSSSFIGANGTNATNLGNLFVATNGPAAQFKITVAGNRIAQRRYLVKINSDSIVGNQVDFFNAATDSTLVPLSVIATASNNVQVTNISNTPNDRLAIYKFELTYPRQFNFGNAANFEFELPASTTSRYLEITAFNNSGLQPVLLDLANGLRLVGDISEAGKIRFLLPPLAQAGKMVLYSQAATNLTAVNGLAERRFINYLDGANQSDYLMISNRLLFDNGAGVNAVEHYAQYRRSAAGGSFNAHIYDVEELTDQFGFGVKKTPLALRNFILFALNRFTVRPKHVLLLGKGTVYPEQRGRESDPNINRLNLVPTFGNPASDILLAAAPGTTVPLVSIGRLSVVSAQEILDYLEKVKQYESAQAQVSPSPAEMGWKKNVAHIIGSGDPNLQSSLEQYMSGCKNIISDTLWGANVHTFTKKTGANVEQISDKALEQLFSEGISFMTYFGHSSNSGLDYNLDNPDAYNNTGKYPLFTALGCNAGNFFGFSTTRFTSKDAISEKYVLARQKGTIGFIASSHFGIVSILRNWNTQFYENIARQEYGRSMGELVATTAANTLARSINGEENYMVRVNLEETVLHGDPALKLNVQPKPDYVITDPMVKIEPGFVSIADTTFKLKVDVQNLGKAIRQKLVLRVNRQYPDLSERELIRDSIPAPLLLNSYEYSIPIDAVQDKGMNKLTVTVDADNVVDELFETNNSVTKEVYVYEDEARPIFPYNFGIVNKTDIKLAVSTANPFSASRNYQIEMDTTELFNSPFKWSQTLTSVGGLLEVRPGISLRNNTVYYWRVAAVPENGAYHWNTSSFVYLQDGEEGFNQSHFYQHAKSQLTDISIDSSNGTWSFNAQRNELLMNNGVFPTAANQASDFMISINNDNSLIRSVCGISNIIVNVFDPQTFKPWYNADGGQPGRFGSDPVCAQDRAYNFQFNIMDTSGRHKLLNFLKMIPEKHYIIVRNTSGTDPNSNTYIDRWKADTAYWGAGNSIYHELYNNGFTQIDSFTIPRAWLFIYRKNDVSSFTPKQIVSQGIYDKIQLLAICKTPLAAGTILSPKFGPAKNWQELKWEGRSVESTPTDNIKISVIGISSAGATDTLRTATNSDLKSFDLSFVDAKSYPYLKVHVDNKDTLNYTPYQLTYLRLTYDPVPEGAVAPNLFFQMKDTLEIGENIEFKMAFKNVSAVSFDSIKLKLLVIDRNNVAHPLPVPKLTPLNPGDTLQVHRSIDTRQFSGVNTLYVQVNPDEDQPEAFHFNNFIYRTFYVEEDKTAPIVDVTFDNVRILNRDIVSAKPDILIKLTDESRRLLLNDTSLLTIKVRNLATNAVRTYSFDNDTLRFVPATQAGQNVASVHFKPYFSEDGEYELLVSGKDKMGNQAGSADYRVSFQVINKPMISNMLNYPNPFTTSTAFVFTLTGSEVPQNLKIQILTVTGKIVREITRQELGTLRIGRNITAFKWDGTDQFGQKLANGVYLYRVVAQLNGKGLEKYRSVDDQTDRYFNKGYGKMYLMR